MKLSKYVSLALIAGILLVAGCANTIRGVGRDVKSSANAVEDAVD